MVSRIVSKDILQYLQGEKKLSVFDIAVSMNASADHIVGIINQKEQFTAKDLDSYLESSKLHFWEFAIKAIPLNHLPQKARKNVLICQEISDRLKKSGKSRKK